MATLAGGTSQGDAGSEDGLGTNASFRYPQGVAISPDGATALISYLGNYATRKIAVATGETTTRTLLGTMGSEGSSDI